MNQNQDIFKRGDLLQMGAGGCEWWGLLLTPQKYNCANTKTKMPLIVMRASTRESEKWEDVVNVNDTSYTVHWTDTVPVSTENGEEITRIGSVTQQQYAQCIDKLLCVIDPETPET